MGVSFRFNKTLKYNSQTASLLMIYIAKGNNKRDLLP